MPGEGADLHFGVEREEADGAIGGGEGMGDVTADGGDVADLRPADDAAAFDEGCAMLLDEVAALDLGVGDGCAEDDPLIAIIRISFGMDGDEAVDVGDINECSDRRVRAILHVEDEIGAARDDLRVTAILLQKLERVDDGSRCVIVLPVVHGGVTVWNE